MACPIKDINHNISPTQ